MLINQSVHQMQLGCDGCFSLVSDAEKHKSRIPMSRLHALHHLQESHEPVNENSREAISPSADVMQPFASEVLMLTLQQYLTSLELTFNLSTGSKTRYTEPRIDKNQIFL